jgi:2-polyprenyl-3-methyl-5-hydroxy-6-metoxy-1,4-benzoquinol methylase
VGCHSSPTASGCLEWIDQRIGRCTPARATGGRVSDGRAGSESAYCRRIASGPGTILYWRDPYHRGRPALASAIQAALRLYDDQPLGIRLFVRARHLLAPLERIAAPVPAQGRILDVGCGHGLFGNLLALQSSRRSVEGVDPSAQKILVARQAARALPNVRYWSGSIERVRGRDYQAITILDVLYLLPPAEKLRLLERCRDLLAPDGVLVLKTNDTAPAWKYAVTRAQEAVMTGIGLTMGHGLYFFGEAQHLELLDRVGFSVSAERLESRLPYPHMLYVCRMSPRHSLAG